MKKIYLDACCLNRPYDNLEQVRVKLESEAILTIFEAIKNSKFSWTSSEILIYELTLNPDKIKMEKTILFTKMALNKISFTEEVKEYAKKILDLGFDLMDAYHISSAVSNEIDFFISTDDKLIKRGTKHKNSFNIRFLNPLDFVNKYGDLL